MTLSVLDSRDREIRVNATNQSLIEMFIPQFIEQDMTNAIVSTYGSEEYNRQFFIYYVNITIFVHLDLQPQDQAVSYAMVYALNRIPAYNSIDKSMDGWTMFCSESLYRIEILPSYDDVFFLNRSHRHYVDHTQTAGSHSLFIGLRELEEKEACHLDQWPTITD